MVYREIPQLYRKYQLEKIVKDLVEKSLRKNYNIQKEVEMGTPTDHQST